MYEPSAFDLPRLDHKPFLAGSVLYYFTLTNAIRFQSSKGDILLGKGQYNVQTQLNYPKTLKKKKRKEKNTTSALRAKSLFSDQLGYVLTPALTSRNILKESWIEFFKIWQLYNVGLDFRLKLIWLSHSLASESSQQVDARLQRYEDPRESSHLPVLAPRQGFLIDYFKILGIGSTMDRTFGLAARN